MTDGQLIAAVRQGDADAWRTLYRRWLPWVWRYACSLVSDTHAAEDITSEAMAAWVRRLGEGGSQEGGPKGHSDDAPQVAAWLRAVVRNKSVDHHRKNGRRRRAIEEVSLMAKQQAESADPALPAESAETACRVTAAMEKLAPHQRLVLEWKYAEGLSVREIADRTGSTEKSVEALLYRSRREFRRHYELAEAQEGHTAAAPVGVAASGHGQPSSPLSTATRPEPQSYRPPEAPR